jgi:hypothetical protein
MNESNTKSTLDIGDTINDAFEIYKKMALQSGLAYMILTFLVVIFAIMGIGYFINLQELPKIMEKFDPLQLSLRGTLLYFGVLIAFSALTSPFIAGMLKMAQEADQNEEVKFSSLFAYINSHHFIHILLVSISISIVSVGLNLAIDQVVPKSLSGLLGAITSISVSILTFIAIPLVIFKNLNFMEALKRSISHTYSHFFILLLLLIISALLAAVGIIAFCFGIFFTLPFVYAMQYSVFKRLG